MSYFFWQNSMASQRLKKFQWLIVIGLLSVAVGCVTAVLLFLLLTFPASTPPRPTTASPNQPALPPTTDEPAAATPVPVVQFEAQQPITGYAHCENYGVYGTISTRQGQPLSLMQVTVWQHPDGGLLAIDSTDAAGQYRIELPGKPAESNVRVQLYRRDRPVSEPLLIKIYFDCQNGYQIYQVNWQQKG
jgi:hypothetical protein